MTEMQLENTIRQTPGPVARSGRETTKTGADAAQFKDSLVAARDTASLERTNATIAKIQLTELPPQIQAETTAGDDKTKLNELDECWSEDLVQGRGVVLSHVLSAVPFMHAVLVHRETQESSIDGISDTTVLPKAMGHPDPNIVVVSDRPGSDSMETNTGDPIIPATTNGNRFQSAASPNNIVQELPKRSEEPALPLTALSISSGFQQSHSPKNIKLELPRRSDEPTLPLTAQSVSGAFHQPQHQVMRSQSDATSIRVKIPISMQAQTKFDAPAPARIPFPYNSGVSYRLHGRDDTQSPVANDHDVFEIIPPRMKTGSSSIAQASTTKVESRISNEPVNGFKATFFHSETSIGNMAPAALKIDNAGNDTSSIEVSVSKAPSVQSQISAVIAQSIGTTTVHAARNVNVLSIRLHPETLGEVKVHFHLSGQTIQVRVVAEREETYNVLQHSKAEIDAAIREIGFDGTGVQLELRQDERSAGSETELVHQGKSQFSSEYTSQKNFKFTSNGNQDRQRETTSNEENVRNNLGPSEHDQPNKSTARRGIYV